jgi:hypothetical protein
LRNALVGVVIGAVLVGAAGYLLGQSDPEPAAVIETVETDRASVVVTDLVETETLRGNLRFRDSRTIRSGLAGTVTGLPQTGEVIGAGDHLMEVDGRPVVVMAGTRPMWRPFFDGMDDGPDVEQLEGELSRLGLFEGDPDETFDDDTAVAVEDWRAEIGLPEGDTIELGRIVFLPSEVRVGAIGAEVGQVLGVGTPVMEVTERSQEVVLELDPDELNLVETGMAVIVVLPDDREIPGRVSEIGRAARPLSPEPDAPIIIDVIVTVEGSNIDLDQAPVDVEVETDRAAGVLAVPVRALVSLSGGGYAVEVDRGDRTELVGVEIGEFAEGLVEVRGPVQEGDLVVIPR